MRVDARLKDYGTDTQRKYIDAVNEHGGARAAARVLKVGPSAISRSILAVKKKAARAGYAPEHDLIHPVPSPLTLKGASTLYGEDGKVKAQWVKSTVDREQIEAATRAAVEALSEDVTRAQPIAAPTGAVATLCNLYTLTDCHVGMRSWKPETGENWDLDIAERTLVDAFSHLVRCSPKAQVALVNQLGDFLHFDSLVAVTPSAGHILDVDSRYGMVVKVAVRILRTVINEALRHHEKVIVLMAEGNHDPASSVWLRHVFSLVYENEPRVDVIDSEMPYYVYKHGQVMLAFHHGHLHKKETLPLLFAAQFPKEWGAATKRYCHTGHYHHLDEKEHSGMKVTQHATMAARDAYASRHGWVADRQIVSVTYHSEFGQVATNTVVPEMLSQ